MNWSDVVSHIEKELPLLAEALQGKNNAAVIIFLAVQLNVAPIPSEVMNALKESPCAFDKLKLLDTAIAGQTDTSKAATSIDSKLGDRSSARNMQIEALHRGKGDFANRFAVVVFLSCFAMISIMLLSGTSSTINDNMRFYVLGFLQSVVMAIIGFYFGSTALSRCEVPTVSR